MQLGSTLTGRAPAGTTPIGMLVLVAGAAALTAVAVLVTVAPSVAAVAALALWAVALSAGGARGRVAVGRMSRAVGLPVVAGLASGFALTVALRPDLTLLVAPAALALACAWAVRRAILRAGIAAAAGVVVLTVALAVALRPDLTVLVAPAALALVCAWAARRAIARAALVAGVVLLAAAAGLALLTVALAVAVRPGLTVLVAPAALALACAWAARGAIVRAGAAAAPVLLAAAAAVLAVAGALTVALRPDLTVLAALAALALTCAWAARTWAARTAIAKAAAAPPAIRVAAPPVLLGAAVGTVALTVTLTVALAVALRPGLAVLAAPAALGAAVAWSARRAIARAAAVAAAVLLAAGIAVGATLALALYPATVLLAALVAGILVLARRSPPLALGAAVLLYACEGSVKILLTIENSPLPGGNREAGAAALDIALFAAIAAVLISDRFRAPRALWASATRLERLAIGVIVAWLALSVLQVAQGGDINRGLHGFRLFQWYTLVALATLTVFMHPRLRAGAIRLALGVGLLVSLYAAVRVVIGPADAERAFATSVQSITMYGDALRAIGTFSSAIGMSSFMTPLAVFGLLLGLLNRRLRPLAWLVGGLALVGVIGSYSRSALFGVALGLACALPILLIARDVSARRRFAAAGLVVAILVGMYGGLLIASRTVPELEARAEGVLDPLNDESVRLRFQGWERQFDSAVAKPLGEGVGAVGAASAPTRPEVRTTDNSFIKVLVEQGFLGLSLFVGGMLAAVVLLARRLRDAAAEVRPIGFAALAGFVSFLGISVSGESVEQPGKVVAWGLLGIAAACAFSSARNAEGEAR